MGEFEIYFKKSKSELLTVKVLNTVHVGSNLSFLYVFLDFELNPRGTKILLSPFTFYFSYHLALLSHLF